MSEGGNEPSICDQRAGQQADRAVHHEIGPGDQPAALRIGMAIGTGDDRCGDRGKIDRRAIRRARARTEPMPVTQKEPVTGGV